MKKYQFECWNVAFRVKEGHIAENKGIYKALKNPMLSWAADPFIIQNDGKYFIFAELYNRITYKGNIQYCVVDADGAVLSSWKRAFSAKEHLSFPYIFRDNGAIYIMPESSHENNVCLYKASSFPEKWEKYAVIMSDIKVADTIFIDSSTLIAYDCFSTPQKLVLYKYEDGVWMLQKTYNDYEKKFRPAGKVLLVNGKTIVPFQDCNGEYGKGIHFSEVNFELERPFVGDLFTLSSENLCVEGISNVVGVHTYNECGSIEVVDVKTRKYNFYSMLGYFLRKLRRSFGK